MFWFIFGAIISPLLVAIGAILFVVMGIYLLLPPNMKGDPDNSKIIGFIVGVILLIVGIVSYGSYKKTLESTPTASVPSDYKVYLEWETTEINSRFYDVILIDDEEKTIYIKTKKQKE